MRLAVYLTVGSFGPDGCIECSSVRGLPKLLKVAVLLEIGSFDEQWNFSIPEKPGKSWRIYNEVTLAVIAAVFSGN